MSDPTRASNASLARVVERLERCERELKQLLALIDDMLKQGDAETADRQAERLS